MMTSKRRSIRTQGRPAGRSIRAITAAVVFAGYFGGTAVRSAQAEVREARINLGEVTAALNIIFAGMQLKLNNYNGSHHITNGSYLQWPLLMTGGQARRQRFNIPEVRQGPYFYYISDVNLERVRFSLSGGRIVLHMAFESRGTELPGRCFVIAKHVPDLKDRIAYRALCAVGNDKAAPDVQWNNLSVIVRVRPQARKGNVYLVDPQVTVGGNPQIGGICNLGFDLCNALTNYKQVIRQGLEARIRSMLASARAQRAIANVIRQRILAQRKIELVASARIVGRTLVLQHGFPSADELNKRSYCLRYSKLAVAAHYQNLRNRCGYTGKGWSGNARGHTAWCMGAQVKASRGETAAREAAIRSCATRKKAAYCNGYLRRAHAAYAANARYRCGFTGATWTVRGASLRDWCIRVSISKSKHAEVFRARQLAECARNRKKAR